MSPLDFVRDLMNPDLVFLAKALFISVMSSLVCGVVGCYVVLRGMAFIGEAVTHAVFPGLAVAFVLQGSLVVGGVVAGIIVSVLVAVFSQNRRVKEDSIIGVFMAVAFALGIVIMSFSPAYAGSLQGFLFGSITGIPNSDLVTASVTAAIVLVGVLLLHQRLVIVSLDREMARAAGLRVFPLDVALYVLVTIAVVISVQTIGNILVLALLITPAATARLLTDRLGVMMLLAPVMGMLSAVAGLYVSWAMNLPVGGTIVLIATAFFLLAWFFAPRHGLIVRQIRMRRGQRVGGQNAVIRVGAACGAVAVAAAAFVLPAQAEPLAAASAAERRVLSAVHTDAISAYVDNGKLTAATKADVDGQEGKRFDPAEIIFNIEPAALTTLPEGVPAWLGTPGQQVYLAPQTWDNRSILWPGFSTQDPALIQSLGKGGQVRYTLSRVRGPGSVEVYLNDNFGGPERWFSSGGGNTCEANPNNDCSQHDIPANTHAHANWVFSQAGRYELTFTLTATVNGEVQSAHATYVFFVGDIANVAQPTQTYLSAIPTADGAGVTLQALVTSLVEGSDGLSYATTGSVTIYRGVDGQANPETLEGMSPVATLPLTNGSATSEAIEDKDGTSIFVGVYTPTYTNEFLPSTSTPADKATPDLSRDGLTMTSADKGTTIRPGSTVIGTIDAAKAVPDGDYVAWIRDTTAMSRRLGTVTVTNGEFSVKLPADLLPSRWHKLALSDSGGHLVVWAEFSVADESGRVPDAPPATNGGDTPPSDKPINNGGNTTVPSTPSDNSSTSSSPTQNGDTKECPAALTLDYGHIDMWNVNYSDGRAILQLKEDVTGSHVLHDPSTVLLRVKESARKNVPAGMPGGGGQAYVLPLTQDSSLIWPGWDTNGMKSGPFTDVSIHITSVQGPGQVYLYSQNSFGGLTSLFTSGGYTFPATIREKTPAHTHAQWTFTAPGIYILTAYAEAANPQTGTSIKTATMPYVFQVGDVPLGDVFCTTTSDTGTVTVATAEQVAAAEAAKKAEEEQLAAEEQQAADENSAAGAKDKKKAKDTQEGANPLAARGPQRSPWVYAGLGAGSVATAGGIGIGTALLIRKRKITLEGRVN